MLIHLREENPQQVHLIRGNHEYHRINQLFGNSDSRLMKIVDSANLALESFYETLALSVYISMNKGKHREYVQCTHGLFELTMDPAPLLDQQDSGTHIPVPKKRKLSDRICKILTDCSDMWDSAKRVREVCNLSFYLDEKETVYNWGDVTEKESTLRSPGYREYALNARDIQHYLNLSSEQHKVMMLFRGHQHRFQHLQHEEKVLVTTLPVGMDCPAYQNKYNQPDRSYIMTPAAKVQDWMKQAILREKGHRATDQITDPYPLTCLTV